MTMRRTFLLISVMGAALLLSSGVALFSGLVRGGSPAAEAQTAPDETLSGVFSVLWGDPRPGSGEEAEIRFMLTDDRGEETELLDQSVARPAGGPLALNGEQVTVEGTSVSADQPLERVRVQEIELARDEATSRAAAAEPASAISGAQPWVTIGCRFADSTGVTPETQSWFQTLMGNTNPGMDNYWQQLSFNNINLTGSQVVDWVNLPQPRSYYVTGRTANEMLTLVGQDCTAAADASVSYPSFVGINLMFNQQLDGAAWGGGMTLTRDGQTRFYSMTWMPPWGYQNQGVLGQEMGYGFGLPHSSGAYGTPYDSDWDVMSSAFGVCASPDPEYGCVGVHTIAYHKDLMGWIPSARKYTATSGTNQNITLERLGVPASTSGYLMAQIPIPGSSTRFYTVEARRFAGYDDELPAEALVIHKVDTTLFDRNAQVVDATPTDADPNDTGARWLPGETFTDSANGISIRVNTATASGYTVTVNPSAGGDTTPPRLTSSAPPPGGTMARRASVRMEFSEALDRETLRTPDGQFKNVELFKYNKKKRKYQFVADTGLTCDAACDTVTLDPFPNDATRLLGAGKYKARIWRDPSGLKDPDGNQLSTQVPAGYLLRDSSLGASTMIEWVFRAG